MPRILAMPKSFKQFLVETPIQNYDTVGDFSRSSSFRDKRDRMLITNPRSIEHIKKKFNATDHVFNFIFVNSPAANRHTEVGKVSLDWVKRNLGVDVAAKVSVDDDDAITIIFTNNKGAQRMPLTGWMMAHRIAHVMNAGLFRNDNIPYQYVEEVLINSFMDMMESYGIPSDTSSSRTMSRNYQLLFKNFFSVVATFKSARSGKVRDWFEITNELIAQYLVGRIRFNPAPEAFQSNRTMYRIKNKEELNNVNETLLIIERDLNIVIGDIFSAAVGSIYVM